MGYENKMLRGIALNDASPDDLGRIDHREALDRCSRELLLSVAGANIC